MEFVEKPFTTEESLSCLKDYVREWFTGSFEKLTPPQEFSFKLICEGENVIITAPTGSGKTLAGFLAILSELFKLSEEGKLENSIYCIYISPLNRSPQRAQSSQRIFNKEIL